MYAIEYKVSLLSPVLISVFNDENITHTMAHLPGSSILGAFASEYIRKKSLTDAHKDETFFSWFLGGEVIFSDAHLLMEHDGQTRQGIPIPLCMQREKGEDRIINRLKIEDPEKKTVDIPGYGWLGNETVLIQEPKRRIHFHHARADRLAGHSNDGLIFNYEALEPGQAFGGTICGSRENLDRFSGFFGPELSARMGRSRQTEYGAVRIELSPLREINFDEEIFERDGVEINEVIISLLAPCILENEYGYSHPSEKYFQLYLAAALGINIDDFKITKCFIKTVKVETYLSVWGMKRPAVTALATGSTFRLEFTVLSDITSRRLAELAWTGLGERRHEGFGRLGLNLATQERYRKENVSKAFSDGSMPPGPMPEAFRTILSSVLVNELRRKVTRRAMDRAEMFRLRPTNSLLGKLGLMVSSVRLGEVGRLFDKLKKPAKSQLEQCNDRKTTLWQFIMDSDAGDFEQITDNLLLDWAGLVEKVSFRTDTKLKEEFFQLFWQVFFHEMRSLNKAGNGEEEAHG
jgi:CRISPR-associated protein Csx10